MGVERSIFGTKMGVGNHSFHALVIKNNYDSQKKFFLLSIYYVIPISVKYRLNIMTMNLKKHFLWFLSKNNHLKSNSVKSFLKLHLILFFLKIFSEFFNKKIAISRKKLRLLNRSNMPFFSRWNFLHDAAPLERNAFHKVFNLEDNKKGKFVIKLSS